MVYGYMNLAKKKGTIMACFIKAKELNYRLKASILVLLFLLLFCNALNAQVTPIYFYGNQLTQDKDKATSYGIYGKLSTENLWAFKRYDLYDNLIQTGFYADELLRVAHGKFAFYESIERFNLINRESFTIKGKERFLAQEGAFVNGLEQGKWFHYFPDGNVFNVQNFVDGKLNGKFITYDRYGNFVIMGNYVDDKKHGEWLLKKGKIRELWEMGVLISREKVKKSKVVKGTIQSENNL